MARDDEAFAASLDRLAAIAEPLQPLDLPCPACGAAVDAPCVPVAGTRIRGGLHPARRPERARAPRGRPASVAYRTTLELTADELARVDRHRGERSATAYLRALPGALDVALARLDSEAAEHRKLGANDAGEAYEDAAAIVRGAISRPA